MEMTAFWSEVHRRFRGAYCLHLLGGTEETYEKPQSGQPASGPGFEPEHEAEVVTTELRRSSVHVTSHFRTRVSSRQ